MLAFALFITQVTEDTKPTHVEVPVWKRATIGEIIRNESSQKFLKDSLMRNPPFRSPFIQTKMSPLDFRIIGLTTEILPGVYLIQLNNRYPLEKLERTWFHELVHVYQFERGLLKEVFGTVFWMGRLNTWIQPWATRPWEIHAEKFTDELFVPSADACEEDI